MSQLFSGKDTSKLLESYWTCVFFTFGQTPVRHLMLYLKRGESLTYGTRETLTYGIGKSLTPFEVVSGAKNGKNFEGFRKG